MPQPGVGYRLAPGARSIAGNNYGLPPWPINQSVHPFEPGISSEEQFARLEQRYGPHRTAGVRGWTDMWTFLIPDSMRARFRDRSATWAVDYDAFDGEPTAEEVHDAFYSGDFNVLHPDHGRPLPRPRPDPTPDPDSPVDPPAPDPVPDPPVDPPPAAFSPWFEVIVEPALLPGRMRWALRNTKTGAIERPKALPPERAKHAARRIAAGLGVRVGE